MIDEATVALPIWMLLSAAFGFIVGEACGDRYRHRKCLEEINADLRDQLEKAGGEEASIYKELKRQRGELNDIHKLLTTVTKTLEKRPS
jgi:hypothetical protein